MEDEFRRPLFPHATPYLCVPPADVRRQHLHRQPLDGAQFGESHREKLRSFDPELGRSQTPLELLRPRISVLYRTWSILGMKKGLRNRGKSFRKPLFLLRRERDSNPRSTYALTRFPSV